MEVQREESRNILGTGTKSAFNPGHTLYPLSHEEIDDRLRRRYLDRLGQTIKKLRKLLVERNWEELRVECQQLAASSETFGFNRLKDLALSVQATIPAGKVSRATTPLDAKETAEVLIAGIDAILIENSRP